MTVGRTWERSSIVMTFLVLSAFKLTAPTCRVDGLLFQPKESAEGAKREECKQGVQASSGCTSEPVDDLLLKSITELYGEWSPWSPCFEAQNKTRIRIRERLCRVPFVCRDMIIREEDDCYVTWKDDKANVTAWVHSKVQYENEDPFYVVSDSAKKFIKRIGINLVPHSEKSLNGKRKKRIYSKWSRWTICTKSCMTQRYRWCKKVEFCGNEVIRQSAFCYTEGTQCEAWILDNMPKQLAQEGNTYSQEEPAGSEKSTTSPLDYDENEVLPNYHRRLPTTSTTTEAQPAVSDPGKTNDDPSCGLLYGRNASSSFSYGPSVERMLRIIGGRASRKGKWPWIVSILNRYKESICGGTLVSGQWVLTAAHCVKKKMYVTIGEHNLAVKDENEVRLRVRKSVIHPDYDPDTVNNDVALLKLPRVSSMVDLQARVVCLPRPWQALPTRQLCTILGWGKRGNGDSSGTDILQEAQVPIVSSQACGRVYESSIVTSNMFCAGYKKGRRDTCSGDSGGPLLCSSGGDGIHDEERWTIFGITSFGEGCGKKGKYGIYTRLPNYVQWIHTVIGS
ncbi:Trypsin [Nesidiocoris tenuis]|uniref:Trypsin n=1 Tax=Nesidiocoris tenuis TaxID=355587 RepID=A0ABN7B5N2_9HEMI|nr:Trypsin [Nesidiocoris tenuis]